MSTALAGSRTGWCSFATVNPGVLDPVATVNTLVDISLVGMKGLLGIPALDVQVVMHAAEGMEQCRPPFLRLFVVSCNGGWPRWLCW